MIRRFEPGEEQAVYELIKRVYDEFVAGDYSEAGVMTEENGIKYLPMQIKLSRL
ncbi:MAG: hypothetical protein AB9922_11185 [Bacteroidales bacterium]